ncbi:hypothetical protein HU147_17415 [Planomicrobium chinense]|nr:hypothetical protein [Planococcus chinensis]
MPSPKDRSDLEGLGAATGRKKSESACLALKDIKQLFNTAVFSIPQKLKFAVFYCKMIEVFEVSRTYETN